MRTEIIKDKQFRPFTVKVTFETKEEAVDFADSVLHNDSIDDVADALEDLGNQIKSYVDGKEE
jgi:hypothetical protein